MARDATPDRQRNLRSRSVLAGQAAAASSQMEHELEATPDPDAAAFFDVDNTIMQGASIFHLARGLHRRKFFTTGDLVTAAWQQLWFRVVGSEDPEHIAKARAVGLAFIAGHSVTELEEIGEEIFDEHMADKIWPGTRAIAQWHLDRGHRVWLVTAAPVEIAQVIARRLGLTGALGTVAEHVDGIYTGALVGEMLHGEGKAIAIREIADRESLVLDECYAYSDSSNDLPMLSLVGHPCAVNPDSTLRTYAKSNGWRVRDYRTGRKVALVGGKGVVAAVAATGTWHALQRKKRQSR